MSQQFHLSLTIGKYLWLKLLILALSWPSKGFAVLALLWFVVLRIVCPRLASCLHKFLELAFLHIPLRDGSTLEFHAHLLKTFACKLHDMKAVYDNLRIGEYLLDDAHHAVGEIHRDFLHCKTFLFRYGHESHCHFCNGSPLDSCDERTTLTMSFLVGEECKEVIVQHTLIYA